MRKGDQLNIAIGQMGEDYGCGAGGTFVVIKKADGTFSPLVVAGGAGGNYKETEEPDCDAQLEEFGNGPSGQHNMDIGSSGESGDSDKYNAGAGYESDAPRATYDYPRCFYSGLVGGEHSYTPYSILLHGGFGGGGSLIHNKGWKSGGGGGYTGGSGSTGEGPAGGGGSFCADKNGEKKLGWYGQGSCDIRYIRK